MSHTLEYMPDSVSQAERDSENLMEEAILHGCPTQDVWLQSKVERILKDIKRVREGIIYLIGQAVSIGWSDEMEEGFIELSMKEKELQKQLITA